MDKIFIVAKREYLERIRSRWFVIMTLLIPVLLVGVGLVPIYMGARALASPQLGHIIVLDATGSDLGDRVAASVVGDTSGTPAATGKAAVPLVRHVKADELPAAEADALHQVMTPNSYIGYLVVDDSTLAGTSARYEGRNASSITDVERLRNAVRQGVVMARLEKEGVNPTTVAQVSGINVRLPAVRVDERGRGGSGTAGIALGIGIGILLLMSIVVHGQAILRGALEEKTTRVAEVVLASVKPETLLAGKVLGVGAVGLTQQVLWIAIGAYLMLNVAPIVLKGTPLAGAGASSLPGVSVLSGLSVGLVVAFFLFFFVGFAFYSSLFAAAGSMVNSEQEAQQAMLPVMLLIMGTWLFVNPVLLNPNGRAAVILSWLPFSSPIILPMRMGLTTVAWPTVVGSLVVAALGSAGVVWLAARIYRVGMLMYGKRPSLMELVRWIRYA